jgi:gas vesicle protein
MSITLGGYVMAEPTSDWGKEIKEAVKVLTEQVKDMVRELKSHTEAANETKESVRRIADDMGSFRTIKGLAGAILLALLGGFGVGVWRTSALNSAVEYQAQSIAKLEKEWQTAGVKGDQWAKSLAATLREVGGEAKQAAEQSKEAASQSKLASLPGTSQTLRLVLTERHLLKSDAKNRLDFQWPLYRPVGRERVSKTRVTPTLIQAASLEPFPEITAQVYGELTEDGSAVRVHVLTKDTSRILKIGRLVVEVTLTTLD